MSMGRRVISVNVGQVSTLNIGEKQTRTGIDKQPVVGRVQVGELGLEGDHIVSKKHHGGPDQAVYAYTVEDYDYWAEALGEAQPPGQFGENLTMSGLESAGIRVGDRLEITSPQGGAGVLLEVTAPRIPCATFAARMGDPGFAKRFAKVGRPGLYLRVLRGGQVGQGDYIRYLPTTEDTPTILDIFNLWYDKNPAREFVQWCLKAPLAIRSRQDLEDWLAKH